MRVRRVGGTRSPGHMVSTRRKRSESSTRARTGRQPSRATTPPRDPRVPRFQGLDRPHTYRARAHAVRAAVLPWASAIPLNGKTAFNVAVLALLGWALMWFFTSDRFYVRWVETGGNRQVSSEVLRQVSGLEGYSVFWINPRQVSAKIMEALPPVKSARVRYGFIGQSGLAGWARLEVVERGTEVVWQVAGQRYWVGEGGELHEVRSTVPTEMGAGPSEAQGEQAAEGPRLLIQDIRSNPPALVDLEALAGARQLIHLLPEVRVLEYAPSTGLRLRHPRGWLVYLGTGEDMPKRVGILRAMEVELAGEDVVQPTLIDLRFPESPYYRLPDQDRPVID